MRQRDPKLQTGSRALTPVAISRVKGVVWKAKVI
jgi:hypothetical protein